MFIISHHEVILAGMSQINPDPTRTPVPQGLLTVSHLHEKALVFSCNVWFLSRVSLGKSQQHAQLGPINNTNLLCSVPSCQV